MKNHTKKIFISYYYSEFCERTIFMVEFQKKKKKKETFVDKTKRKLSKLSLKMKSNIFLLLYNAHSNMFMNQNYCSNEVKKI